MWTGWRMFSKRSNLLPANCCQQSHFDSKLCTKETIYLWGSRGMNLKSSSHFFLLYPSLKYSLELERRDKLNGGDSLDRFGVPQFYLIAVIWATTLITHYWKRLNRCCNIINSGAYLLLGILFLFYPFLITTKVRYWWLVLSMFILMRRYIFLKANGTTQC